MNSPNQTPINIQHVKEVVKDIFPKELISVERVAEGISTYVYRISFPRETFYLRVLPEEGNSFAPEVTVHSLLHHMQIKVPEVIYFEHHNNLLRRSMMVTSEIKGQPLSQSLTLSQVKLEAILKEAGRDLARMNDVLVEGFGWIRRDTPETAHLQAEQLTYRTFAIEYWEADLAYLAAHVLQPSEVILLERILSRYDSWLDNMQGYLVHGDFDTTHIYQDNGQYTGIIDFGEIRGANHWYDLGHFHMRDRELLPFQLLSALVSGYKELVSFPLDYEQRIRFTGLLINVRTLARSLQKRPANRYTQHQLEVLREDIVFL